VHSFNVTLETMVVTAIEPKDFIVFLPDIVTGDWVFNDDAPLPASGFPLFFRRWTRVANAETATLLSLIQVELHGIPAHVWWTSTTQ
jgi:hypothetical protein